MNNYKDIQLIENYRSGMLNEQETIDFNARLKSDNSFKELYDDFFESEKLLKLKELWAVKEELNKLDYSLGEDNRGHKGKLLWGLSLIVLLGAGSIYFATSKKSDSVTPEIPKTVLKEEPKEQIPEYTSEIISSDKKPILKATLSLQEERIIEAYQDTTIKSDLAIADIPQQLVEKIIPVEENKCNESPEADIITKGTCPEENNGVVIIKGIKGNYGPYRIMTDSLGSHFISNKAEFKGLKYGRHFFYLIDNRDCRTSLSVTVDKIECVKEGLDTHKPVRNYLIYLPGQIWKVPMTGKRGILEILDQKGNVVINQEVLKDENDEWVGMDLNSREVEPGVYFYLIKEEGIKDKTGTITIIK